MATALVETRFRDGALESIRDKVMEGRRLSFEDGLALYRSHDLLAVGLLANLVRERRHGDAAYFVWNTHVNHTPPATSAPSPRRRTSRGPTR
jgi:aminodeoxyfutalosine synthase